MDNDDQINIRARVRSYGARQLTLARLAAPDDWQDELRSALVDNRQAKRHFARDSDVRLFAESFAIFFTAAMVFLL